jgi:hypothetical protein
VARRGWVALEDEALLDVRLCDLGLRIAGTQLAARLARVERELAAVDLARFRPYVWLSTGWFTPHGMTGFAIPFFLAHPRLVRLERRMMGEVEGDTERACMRLLRHELAHALDHAHRLHRRRSWREHFGRFSQPYRASYRPVLGSRRFVANLPHGYAQSHPGEDWAETFAVWLDPGSRWRSRYAGWPALRKLRYVDGLMREIAGRPPAVRTRERSDALPELRFTLREYYRRKRARQQRVLRGRRSRDYLR